MERIREHILETARAEAEAAVKAARKEAEARTAAARDRITRESEQRLARDLAAVERDHRQALDQRAFENRLDLLKRKSAILDEVFARAAERFIETPRYRDWLTRRVASVADLEGEVRCNVRDRAVCRAALDRLAGQGAVNLTMAKEAADITGGLIVRTERFDLDITLGAALKDLRGRVTPDLVALAFAGLDEGGRRDQ